MRWVLGQLPSFGVCLWGVLLLWIAGDKKRLGWALGILGEAFWVVYAVWLHQWGLILGAVMYAAIYARNFVKWGSDGPARQDSQSNSEPLRDAVGT